MAIFNFKCLEHGDFSVYLNKGSKIQPCPKCGKESKRVLGIGTVRVTERIDNGLMAKSIERLQNVEELMDERIRIHEKSLIDD